MSIGPHPPYLSLAFDNDVLNDWFYQKPFTLKAISDYVALTKTLPAIPAPVVFEILQGFERSIATGGSIAEKAVIARKRVLDLIAECSILDFNKDAAEITAFVFARLSQSDRNKHWTDVMIAATVIAHDHVIATRNRTDFELIATLVPPQYPALKVQIWKPK